MRIVKTTIKHLKEVAENISAGDRAEFEAMKPGRNIQLVLLRSLGETSRTIVDCEGHVLATGGSRGCLWFVTTNRVAIMPFSQKLRFLRTLEEHLECVRKFTTRDERTNFVHVENKQHVRLLEYLGAEFDPYAYSTETGARFRQFWL